MGIELIDYKDCLILAVPSKNEEGRWILDLMCKAIENDYFEQSFLQELNRKICEHLAKGNRQNARLW